MSNLLHLLEIIRENAVSLNSEIEISDEVLSLIGDARLVLIGEATHGTREFYRHRAALTKKLIEDRGFSAVAVEAGFPNARRVDRYARHLNQDKTAEESLGDFQRFPLWLWRNEIILEFVEWLREHNADKPPTEQTGFYGIDLYSLHASIKAALNFLERKDSVAAKAAQERYSCFDYFGADAQNYGYVATNDERFSCEDAAANQILELRRRAAEYTNHKDRSVRDDFFSAEQNARLVKNAEEYFRYLFKSRADSWNRRERHMAETLEALTIHLEEENQAAKIIVWAHNAHAGDARATEMYEQNEASLGQIVRETYRNDAVLLGYTTYAGTVTAAADWHKNAEVKQIKPAREESCEMLFHKTGLPAFFLNLRDKETVRESLRQPLLMRSIGAVYQPEIDGMSRYVATRLSEQFDGIIHFDETRAVKPLDTIDNYSREDTPDCYPTGF